MSYILDALKKSDQQRQRGATPTLQAAQLTVAAPKRPLFIYYGVLAAVLLVTGIMIGWLRPWHAEQALPAASLTGTEAVATHSPAPVLQQTPATLITPAPLATAPEIPGKTAQEIPAPNLSRAGQAVPGAVAVKPNSPAIASSGTPDTGIPDSVTPGAALPVDGAAHEQKAIPMDELPVQIQREIPAMTVQLHAYSNLPDERIVYINSNKLREGQSLMPGLRLEQITPDGMIFSYKGYRFRHGIR